MGRTFKVFLFGIWLLGMAGCVTTPEQPKPHTALAVSKQVTLVEVSGDGRRLYEAWGVGEHIEAAKLDAQRAALWAALYMGEQRLLNTVSAQEKFKPHAQAYYARVQEYVRYLSAPLSKRVDAQDRVHLRFRVAIDVQQLREQLLAEGILADNAQINQTIGLPSVVVLPKTPKAKVAANTLEQYLVGQGFSLVDKKAQDKSASLIEKVARLSGQVDPMFIFATQLGADVYIETDAVVQVIRVSGIQGAQASVQARAYETASGQLLGSTTGYSEKRVDTLEQALIQEAAHEAADRLTATLLKVWQQQAAQGVWFKLVVGLAPTDAEAQEIQLYEALSSLKPTQLKRLRAGAHSVSYLVRLKNMPDATSLYYTLKKRYVGTGQLRRELESGRLLILRLDEGEGDMQLD